VNNKGTTKTTEASDPATKQQADRGRKPAEVEQQRDGKNKRIKQPDPGRADATTADDETRRRAAS
jgi:hypothetical protein